MLYAFYTGVLYFLTLFSKKIAPSHLHRQIGADSNKNKDSTESNFFLVLTIKINNNNLTQN